MHTRHDRLLALLLTAVLLFGGFAARPRTADAASETLLLYSCADFSVVLTGYNLEDVMGPELQLRLKNSSKMDLNFSSNEGVVNEAYMTNPHFLTSVKAGQTVNAELSFDQGAIEYAGCNYIDSLWFYLSVKNAASPFQQLYYDALCLGFPMTGPKPADTPIDFGNDGVVVVDTDEYHITVLGLLTGQYSVEMVMRILNPSDKGIRVELDDVHVNGQACDAIFSCPVVAGAIAYDDAFWFTSLLKEKNIGSVDEVSFTLMIYRSQDYLYPLYRESFTIEFS